MNKNIRLFLLSGLLALGLASTAGDQKLYITTNQEQYGAAETVRFQAILLAASSGPRHSLFAELYDCRGNRLSKKVFPVMDQLASGSVDLPANAPDEFYLLYCYTLNSDGLIEYDHIKKIYTRAARPVPIPASWSVKDLSIEVFVEGNTFIAQLSNTILFKSFYQKEKPLAVTARIINEKNEVAGVFQTNEQGFAKIQFTPEEKGSYFIAVEDNEGNEKQVYLPAPAAFGVSLTAFTLDSLIYCRLTSYTSNSSQPKDYKIQVLSNNEPVYDAEVNFKQGVSEVLLDINANSLPEGYLVVQVKENGIKHVERIIYNTHTRKANAVIKVVDTVQHREAVIELPRYINGKGYLQLTAFNKDRAPVPSGLNSYGKTILVPVLEQPAKPGLEFNDHLIALKQLDAGRPGTTPDQYISLSGSLYSKDMKPLKNKTVNIIIVQKNLTRQFYVTTTDETGKLKIDNLLFFDTANVYYQLADKSEEKNTVILVPDPAPSLVSDVNAAKIRFACSMNSKTTSAPGITITDDKTLQQVTVKGQVEKTDSEKFEDKYVSPMLTRKTNVRNEIDFIKNPQVVDHTSLFEFIRSRFAGLIIKILMDGTPRITTTFFAPVGVYLNDLEISPSDLSVLAGLQVKDIAQVKYYPTSFKPKQISGNPFLEMKAQDGGDLVIYTKRDFMGSDAGVQGLPKIKLAGYDIEKLAANSLYWNPNYTIQPQQVIYTGLPAAATGIQLKLEGLNNTQVPYSFSKELIFK